MIESDLKFLKSFFSSPHLKRSRTQCRLSLRHLYQSINQCIYNAPWYRGACYSADYAEAKRNVLSRVLNVLTDGI